MTDDGRETVRALDDKRRDARARLNGDAGQARHDLHPRTLMRRWTERKKEQLADLADGGKKGLKKNAPLIGLTGAAILLFAARKPISKLFNSLREQAKDRKS
jgi:hypothetical protein